MYGQWKKNNSATNQQYNKFVMAAHCLSLSERLSVIDACLSVCLPICLKREKANFS